ncbi:MAG: universal stress protein [Candidatus Hecatellaceae archaeon]
MFARILAPVDGSETSFKALDEACRLAKTFGSKVTVLYVVDTRHLLEYEEEEREDLLRKLRTKGLKVLEQAESKVKTFNVVYDTLLREGNPAEVIVEVADELKVELIVMGTRGLTGLRKIVVGSTTYKVVEWASCHVLVIK